MKLNREGGKFAIQLFILGGTMDRKTSLFLWMEDEDAKSLI